MSIILYYTPMGSATRVHWALNELGVPFEKVRVHMDKGDSKKPEFLAINPNGKVPALIDGSLKLFESLAIMFHLGDRYGEKAGLWPASGSDARSEGYLLSVYAMVEIQTSAFDFIRHGGNHARLTLPAEKRVKEVADRALGSWKTGMTVLGERLAREPQAPARRCVHALRLYGGQRGERGRDDGRDARRRQARAGVGRPV